MEKRTEEYNIPENLTTDDVVNFLKPFNRSVYSDSDLRTFLNSSISSDVKITAINSVAKAVALNVNQMLIFREMVKQLMQKLQLKFRHFEDEKDSGSKFEGIDKVIQMAIPQYEEEPPLNKDGKLDFVKFENLQLLTVVNNNAEGLNKFHDAVIEKMSVSLNKGRRYLEEAGILNDEKADDILSDLKGQLLNYDSFVGTLNKLQISDLNEPIENHLVKNMQGIEEHLKSGIKRLIDKGKLEKIQADENHPFHDKSLEQIIEYVYEKSGMKKDFEVVMKATNDIITTIKENPEEAKGLIVDTTKSLHQKQKWTEAHNGREISKTPELSQELAREMKKS